MAQVRSEETHLRKLPWLVTIICSGKLHVHEPRNSILNFLTSTFEATAPRAAFTHQQYTHQSARNHPLSLGAVMCGIFCSVSRHDHIPPSPTIEGRLKARGPDAANQILVQCPIKDDLTTTVTCYSTVLSLRGQVTTVQPLQKAVSGSVLCWNGEAWAVDGERLQGNDTERILDLLTAAVDQSAASSSLSQIAGFGAQLLSRALSRIEGPYAFVFYDASKSRLYFGRDFLGRRSLLWRCTASGDLLLSSVSDESSGDAWAEVEADGIYCLDLASQSRGRQVNVSVPNQKACFSVTKLPYALHDEQERSNLSVGHHYVP